MGSVGRWVRGVVLEDREDVSLPSQETTSGVGGEKSLGGTASVPRGAGVSVLTVH